ncbi:MAG: hypothetical protein HC919_12665 [Oscillatoriales cyanobacterium SM2_2_1]|nr:hypothetical protein [Oscillatoriales cyanobacterium SM2_2_1]
MDILRSLPVGLYLEQPGTWLHHLDPRLKLFWLLTFLLSPFSANVGWRTGVVVALVGVTLSMGLPWRVWRQQMGLLLLLAVMTFVLALVSPDGFVVTQQPRRPLGDGGLPPATDFRYVLLEVGNLRVTQRSLDLALRIGTLIFTFLYGPTLYLLVTAPEEITTAVGVLAGPLGRWRWPVVEAVLTLTLALRFVPLVLEELQNLVRAVRTRAIPWKRLGLRRSLRIWLLVAERLVRNLFLRAEQTAAAMQVRGFTSAEGHDVKWHRLQFGWGDRLLLVLLGLAWLIRWQWGGAV